MSHRRVFQWLFQVLPNLYKCFRNFMEMRKEHFLFTVRYKGNAQNFFSVFAYRYGKWLLTMQSARMNYLACLFYLEMPTGHMWQVETIQVAFAYEASILISEYAIIRLLQG